MLETARSFTEWIPSSEVCLIEASPCPFPVTDEDGEAVSTYTRARPNSRPGSVTDSKSTFIVRRRLAELGMTASG
jgi:hypothetical protein